VADFLFEVGLLKVLPRSGWQFLGTGRESVADHSLRVCFLAWTLARLVPEADRLRLLELALFHDLPEARCGDLNSVNKLYVSADVERAWKDTASGLPFGAEIEALAAELAAGRSLEARLVHDADQLEMLLSLKERQEAGNPRAAEWIAAVKERLLTDTGRGLAEAILSRRADRWWLSRLKMPGGGGD